MIIHGKDIRFRLTVGASGEIADLCPDRDINRIGDMLSGAYGDSIITTEKFCRILNKWYVRCERFAGRKADSLEEGETLTLDADEFKLLMAEAMKVFQLDAKTEIETEPSKKASKGE